MSRPAVGDPELAARRWQVFNSNYGIGGGAVPNPARRRKLGLLIQSSKPWAARYDGSDEGYEEFLTHGEAMSFALSRAVAK